MSDSIWKYNILCRENEHEPQITVLKDRTKIIVVPRIFQYVLRQVITSPEFCDGDKSAGQEKGDEIRTSHTCTGS